jgi:hypothetical protein
LLLPFVGMVISSPHLTTAALLAAPANRLAAGVNVGHPGERYSCKKRNTAGIGP